LSGDLKEIGNNKQMQIRKGAKQVKRAGRDAGGTNGEERDA
jgi:hypothetical protein